MSTELCQIPTSSHTQSLIYKTQSLERWRGVHFGAASSDITAINY